MSLYVLDWFTDTEWIGRFVFGGILTVCGGLSPCLRHTCPEYISVDTSRRAAYRDGPMTLDSTVAAAHNKLERLVSHTLTTFGCL